MLRRLTLCLCLLPGPALAEDIFVRMTGTYGALHSTALSCRENPHHLTFSADRRRALFRMEREVTDYEGKHRREAAYSVLGHDDSSITMALDGESRRTAAGAPVIWILRIVPTIDGYCWGRTDWPPLQCNHTQIRCEDPPPAS